MNSRVPSSIATGGGGSDFEQQVGGMCLSLLLVHECYPEVGDCRVEEVYLQPRIHDYETDDILVIGSTGKGEQCRLALQAKLRFTFRPSSRYCVETFQKFWKDFNAPDRFDPAKDKLLLVTPNRGGMLQSLVRLLQLSRDSSCAQDFKCRLDAPGFVDFKVRKCHEAIRSIVERIDSPDKDEEKFWRFLKTIRVHFVDFTISKASEEAVLRLLAQYARDRDQENTAKATWNELVMIASDSAPRAKTLHRSDLPEEMLEKYDEFKDPATKTLTSHSKFIIDNIRSDIAGQIALPRRETIDKALSELEDNRVVALAGPPGSGKSALAKSIIQHYERRYLCLSFKSEEFGESHIDRALPDPISGGQFESIICSRQRVIVHVESLERLLEYAPRDAFAHLVGIVKRCPRVLLLLTCREQVIDRVAAEFFDDGSLTCRIIQAPPFNSKEIGRVAEALPDLRFLLESPELKQLLRRPYFIDMAARLRWPDRQGTPADGRAFREKCWSDVVRSSVTTGGLPDRREEALICLALKRARALRPFVSTDGIDPEALNALYNDGIVTKEETGLAAPAHDVIEDWAIMRWADKLAAKHEWQAGPMANDVGPHPAVRRGFVEWLKEGFDVNDTHAHDFVRSVYNDDSLLKYFRDAVMVSALLSNSADDFIFRQRGSLLADNAQPLIKMIRLTRTACRKLPDFHSSEGQQNGLLIPNGKAWPALLEIVADNIDTLLPGHTGYMLDLLEDWSLGANLNCPTPDGAASAGIIVDRILDQAEGYDKRDQRKRALKVLTRVPRCNEGLFLGLIEQSGGSRESSRLSHEFVNLLISENDGMHACIEFPEQMSRLALSRYRLSEEDPGQLVGSGVAGAYTGSEFGLNPGLDFHFPPSAYKGPFLFLLLSSPGVGLQLVLDLVNHAGRWYGRRNNQEAHFESLYSISISVPGHGKVAQWTNERLWLAYRGLGRVPVILQCALMALESWLLNLCEKSNDVKPFLLEILRRSDNVMTTAVVASVCNAHPDLCGTAAFPMLESRKCVELDIVRRFRESETKALSGLLTARSQYATYASELRKSNALQHRQRDLRDLALALQLKVYAAYVQRIIDAHLAELPDDASKTESDRQWQLTLYSMDLRNADFANATPVQDDISPKNESGTIMSVPFKDDRMGTGLRDYLAAGESKRHRFEDAVSLWYWAQRRLEGKPTNEDPDELETILALAKKVQLSNNGLDSPAIPKGGPETVAAVCVKDHSNGLAEDDLKWCVETLVSEVERDSDGESPGVNASKIPTSPDVLAAHVLPKVLAEDPDNARILEAVSRAIIHASQAVSVGASVGVAEYLWPRHRGLTLRCAGAAAMMANLLTDHEQRHNETAPMFTDMRVVQTLFNQTRQAFVKGDIDPERELRKLDPASRHGRYASELVLRMLAGATDRDLTKDLFIRTGRAIVDAWTARHSSYDTPEYYNFNDISMPVMASIVLTLPSDKIPLFCQPFLDAVSTHPEDVAFFVDMLVAQQNLSTPESSFWDAWQAFADRILKSSWPSHIDYHYSAGIKLIESMLFKGTLSGNIQIHLHGHEEKVNNFVSRLPVTPPLLTSFSRYLSTGGDRSLPDAFTIVAGMLQAGNPTELLTENAVFMIESVLQRYVYGQPRSLKTNPALRDSALSILDSLVDMGSSSAYRMRDDFVTPSADSS